MSALIGLRIKIAQLTQGRAETREKSEMCFVPLGIFLILTSGLLWHFNYAQPTFLKEREKKKKPAEDFSLKFSAQCIQQVLRLIGSGCCHDSTSSLCQPSPLSLPLARLRPSSLLLLTPLTLSLWISPHPPSLSLSLSLLERTSGDNTLALSVFCCCRTDRKASRLHPLLPCQTGNSDQGKTSENTMCSVRAGLSCQCLRGEVLGVRVEGGWTSALVGCAVCALERHRAATLRLSVQC